MSAVWFHLITTFCLVRTSVCNPESSAVEWRNVGDSITIQCKSSEKDPKYATVMRGLNKDLQIVTIYKKLTEYKTTIKPDFETRLQVDSEYPNFTFILSNLTSADTGPYWCVYKKVVASAPQDVAGTGSVLLVVTDNNVKTDKSFTPGDCDQSNKSLVVTSIVISAVVLLGLVVAFAAFIKTKTLSTESKPRPVPHNDVYEDMRGTIRR